MQIGFNGASVAFTAADSVPLKDLDVKAAGLLLTTMGDLGSFRDQFLSAKINGIHLSKLEEKSQLQELGIQMPDLLFKELLYRTNNVM